MVDAAASMENDVMMSEFNANNGAALTRLLSDQGVQLKRFSDDTYDSFGEAAAEVFAETIEHSDLAKRIHESFEKARADVGGWAKIADQEYLQQRKPGTRRLVRTTYGKPQQKRSLRAPFLYKLKSIIG